MAAPVGYKVPPIRCRRPRHQRVSGLNMPGDWNASDPRFRIVGGRSNARSGAPTYWTVLRNGPRPILFDARYGLSKEKFATRRDAARALTLCLQLEADLPEDQRVLDPVAPDPETYERENVQETEQLVKELCEYHRRGEQHPWEPHM